MTEEKTRKIQLKGRVIITFDLKAVTGLHIGGSDVGVEIGGVDKTVLRDPITNRPYIPGSSLKGKMRSLLEKYHGLDQNQRINQSYIHSCQDKEGEKYNICPVCQIFGVSGDRDYALPPRLVVRDVFMDNDSAIQLTESGRTMLPYTEVKTEVAIDRVTAQASPRQLERVPAGTYFKRAELVYSIYDGMGTNVSKDANWLRDMVVSLRLLEDDYLGGTGTRGSGKVAIEKIEIQIKKDYLEVSKPIGSYETMEKLVEGLDPLITQVSTILS